MLYVYIKFLLSVLCVLCLLHTSALYVHVYVSYVSIYDLYSDHCHFLGMLLSPSPGGGGPMGVVSTAGIGGSGPRTLGGPNVGVPLEACRMSNYVSPLRLHPPLYERLHGIPSLPLDPALLSAAHQVGLDIFIIVSDQLVTIGNFFTCNKLYKKW